MLYQIIEGYNTEQMGDYIQPLLDDGWMLHGNLLLMTYRTDDGARIGFTSRPRTIYAQTLVKEETPEELDARVSYLENLLLKPLDKLTPEERQAREDYLEDLEDEKNLEDQDA
jgi:hypothetical protein